jgi:translation initiation factor IF-3
LNNQIQAKEVRLIDSNGEQIGIKTLEEALKYSEDKGFDLVEIAPQAKPPVCKVMDYGKFKYEQAKKAKEAKKKQNVMNIKEIQMGVKIEEHDFNVKLKMAQRFLSNKDKVKVRVKFRGRELMYKELGYQLMDKLASRVEELANVESRARMEGRNMIMILTPISDK